MKRHALHISKNNPARHFFVGYGKRASDINQVLPIWNTSNNCQKSILIGFGKYAVELGYRY
jgi:hypothetical protein